MSTIEEKAQRDRAVLDVLLAEGAMPTRLIADETGYPRPAITASVTRLKDAGKVRSVRSMCPSCGARGRLVLWYAIED